MHEKERRLGFSQALQAKLTEWYGPVVEITGDSRLSKYYCYFRANNQSIVAINDFEPTKAVEGILTFAVLFREFHHKESEKLTLLLPATSEPAAIARLQLRLSCVKYDTELLQLDYYLAGMHSLPIPSIHKLVSQPSEEVARRYDQVAFFEELGLASGFASDVINEIKRLSPLVDTYYFKGSVSFRINGLEFARLMTPQDKAKWRLHVGVGSKAAHTVDTPLPSGASKAVRELAQKVATYRVPDGNKKSTLYKLQPEHWLESIILKTPSLLSPDIRSMYTQVATDRVAGTSKDVRHYIDALCIHSNGGLSVVEIKVAADVHAVFQVIDYWLWVERNKTKLQAHNYFPDHALNTSLATKVYLVAPEGQFHPHLEHVIRALRPEIFFEIVPLPKKWRELVGRH